tara:strand:- start:294 stop:731 length:438 start_codon:yes stop_codon:yes gene_type:complete
MNKIKVAFAALLMAVLASPASAYTDVRGGKCATFTALGDGYAEFFAVGISTVNGLDLSFDRDNLGSATSQTLTLEFCSLETAASCGDYDFDTNGDLTPDTNILTDITTNVLTSGIRDITGFNFLRISETGTYVATASFTVCRREG